MDAIGFLAWQMPSDEYLFDGKVGGPTIEKPAVVEEPPPVDGAR